MKNKHKKSGKNSEKRSAKEEAPYNVCDRFCDRCGYRKKCGVFRDTGIVQIRDITESDNPQYIKSIFRDLEKGLKEIKATLKMAAKEKGININDAAANKKFYQNRAGAEADVKNNPLYKISRKFAKNADSFLKKIFLFSQNNNPFLLPALNEDIGNLSFYFGALLSKVHYALLCAYDSGWDEKQKYARANYSICIALNACMVCEKSIGNIAREVPEFFVEYLELVTVLKNIRSEIKRIFPDVEKFQNDIIFNTPLR